jgi:hypothetical protein
MKIKFRRFIMDNDKCHELNLKKSKILFSREELERGRNECNKHLSTIDELCEQLDSIVEELSVLDKYASCKN